MQLEHYTSRLKLSVLNPSRASLVLDFYKRNKNFLDPFEPEKGADFYTEGFHQSNLTCEYNAFIKSDYIRFWICERNNPEILIGTICFSNFQRGAFMKCNVGYKIDQSYCKKGYATEALNYTLQLVFEEYRIHRIEAIVQPDNHASIRLLKHLGFQKEGLLHSVAKIDGQWTNHLLYALVNRNS